MILSVRSYFLSIGLAAIMTPAIASAQTAQPTRIDSDLRGQWDFRDTAFSDCFEQTECFALGVTINGERRDEDDVTWVPAPLYWDPVDGIGVLAGGQNDEIDFDERVLITFPGTKDGTVNVERIWLSDIFIGEDERYGNSDPSSPDDVEVAVIRSWFAGDLLYEARVDGADVLPPDPFNEEVIAGFAEGADLFRRVIFQNDTLTIIVPPTEDGEELQRWSFPIGVIDEERRALFEGLDTVEIDLTNILSGFNDIPFSSAGSANAEFVNQILDDVAELQAIRAQAADTRLVGTLSNGELGVQMDNDVDVEVLIFTSVLGGSNDYSIAGIVQALP